MFLSTQIAEAEQKVKDQLNRLQAARSSRCSGGVLRYIKGSIENFSADKAIRDEIKQAKVMLSEIKARRNKRMILVIAPLIIAASVSIIWYMPQTVPSVNQEVLYSVTNQQVQATAVTSQPESTYYPQAVESSSSDASANRLSGRDFAVSGAAITAGTAAYQATLESQRVHVNQYMRDETPVTAHTRNPPGGLRTCEIIRKSRARAEKAGWQGAREGASPQRAVTERATPPDGLFCSRPRWGWGPRLPTWGCVSFWLGLRCSGGARPLRVLPPPSCLVQAKNPQQRGFFLIISQVLREFRRCPPCA